MNTENLLLTFVFDQIKCFVQAIVADFAGGLW